jgi:hypothetical protein
MWSLSIRQCPFPHAWGQMSSRTETYDKPVFNTSISIDETLPRSLFNDFCDRCSPPIQQRRKDEIWNWVKEPVNPSINDDTAFQNCIDAWKRKQRKLVTNNT